MVAVNSDVPPMGSDEIKALAEVYEQTILRSLHDGYEVDVYSIGGVSVGSDGSYSSMGGLSVFNRRNLQSSSDVLFNLRTVKPCPDCSQMDASVLGAEVFTKTFDRLEEKAESGQLTVLFCVIAEMANVIAAPCVEEITSVVGESLTMDNAETDAEPPTAPVTTSPSASPPVVATLSPTTAPPVVPDVHRAPAPRRVAPIAIDRRIAIAGKVRDAPPSVLRAQDCGQEDIQIRIRAVPD